MKLQTMCMVLAVATAGLLGSAEASANLLLNPGFELPDLLPPNNQAPGADNWTTFNIAGVRTIQQHSGDQSLRLAPDAPTGTNHGIARQEFAASANDVLTFGAWVLNPSSDPLTGTRQAELRVQWLNASNVLINQTILKVADANTPQDLWINWNLVELTLPNNPNIVKVWPSLFVTNNGGTGGGVAFFDDVQFLNLTANPPATIPEPASLGLLGLGGLALASGRNRNR